MKILILIYYILVFIYYKSQKTYKYHRIKHEIHEIGQEDVQTWSDDLSQVNIAWNQKLCQFGGDR